MMKHPRLSTIFAAVAAASLVLVSSSAFAHKRHKVVVEHEHDNYKAEANYKAEVPPPCPPVRALLGGFYVGAGVSYDSYRFSNTVDLVDGDDSIHLHNHTSARGWDGELNLGYGQYWDMFYLGGEVHGVISGADGSANFTSIIDGETSSGNSDVKARGSWAVSLLPGLKLNDSTLAYIRLGYIQTDFKASASVTTDDGTFSASRSKWKGGFLGGVGMETYLADNVSLRGEYQYSTYSNFSNTFGHSRPSNSSYTLGLQYHFC